MNTTQTSGYSRPELTSGRIVARNAGLNLIGQMLPMLVALPSVPLLVRSLGTERFGVLALVLTAIGYFGLFDLGLGRALTQLVARKLGKDEESELTSVVWPGLLVMAALGLAGAGALAAISEGLVTRVLRVPVHMQQEAIAAFYLLSLSLPFVITTAGLIGILAAYQRFGTINAIGVPMGALAFAAPALVASATGSLEASVATIVGVRFLGWLGYVGYCFRGHPLLRGPVIWRRDSVRTLLGFGGWMTVSNIVGPVMVYMDRFVLGALLSMSAVAYYVAPYELVTKLWVIPAALTASLFPAFASSASGDAQRTRTLYDGGVAAVLVTVFPIALLLVSFAPELLRLWLGTEFSKQGAPVLRWLAIGVFLNCVGQIPFAALQGIGRPDLTAKLHLFELPVYLAVFVWMVGVAGIQGAAIAWVLRVAFDTAALFWLARSLIPGLRPNAARGTAAAIVPLATFGVASALGPAEFRALFFGLVTLLLLILVARNLGSREWQIVRGSLFMR
jgi:O-antigen/teichoic acid export membrane protein